jgi:hypothetical protein
MSDRWPTRAQKKATEMWRKLRGIKPGDVLLTRGWRWDPKIPDVEVTVVNLEPMTVQEKELAKESVRGFILPGFRRWLVRWKDGVLKVVAGMTLRPSILHLQATGFLARPGCWAFACAECIEKIGYADPRVASINVQSFDRSGAYKQLRRLGWLTKNGRHGRFVCPRCRAATVEKTK